MLLLPVPSVPLRYTWQDWSGKLQCDTERQSFLKSPRFVSFWSRRYGRYICEADGLVLFSVGPKQTAAVYVRFLLMPMSTLKLAMDLSGGRLLHRRMAKVEHVDKCQTAKAAKKKKKVKKAAVVPSDAVSVVETHPGSKGDKPCHAAMRPFQI